MSMEYRPAGPVAAAPTFALYHGIAGRRTAPGADQEGRDPLGLRLLRPGELVERSTTNQDLGCPGCSRAFCQHVWLIRCADCSKLQFPRLVIFAACDACGGQAVVWQRHADHQQADHAGSR